MVTKHSETVHPSKKSPKNSKATEGSARGAYERINNGSYSFEFDGTQYIAIPKGGNTNVRVK